MENALKIILIGNREREKAREGEREREKERETVLSSIESTVITKIHSRLQFWNYEINKIPEDDN